MTVQIFRKKLIDVMIKSADFQLISCFAIKRTLFWMIQQLCMIDDSINGAIILQYSITLTHHYLCFPAAKHSWQYLWSAINF